MDAWMIWLGVALVLIALETVTVDFIFIMLGGGALGASIAAAVGAPFIVQCLVAAAGSVALLVGVRPWLKRRFGATNAPSMGAAGNVGRAAYTLDRVSPTEGRVKLSGETWSARTRSGTIEPGLEVTVDAIDGATAIVSVRAQPTGLTDLTSH